MDTTTRPAPLPRLRLAEPACLNWRGGFRSQEFARLGGRPDSDPHRTLPLRSDSANVLRLGTFLSLSRVVLNRLSILQISESVTDDIGIVTKEIFAPVFRCDESVTLLLTEPLDCTVGQTSLSLIISDTWRLLRAVTPLILVRTIADCIGKNCVHNLAEYPH